MKIISNKKKLIKVINNEKNLGFVPTMGSIHAGHIHLIRRSINQCKRTIVSIYVNRPQFDRKTDFYNYPRSLKKDITKLKKIKVDFLYIPKTSEIYPRGINKKIKINLFRKKLCGKYRSGHFEAIVDVVDRFIKIIKPSKIFLGEKDMQQLKLIEDFARRKYPDIKIVPCKTVREKNGIAYSSRNNLLSFKEKEIASKIYNLLKNKKKEIIKNKFFLRKIKKIIGKLGIKKIDYIEILNINKLIKPFKKTKKYKIFIAYYIRSTRLIDNI